MGDNRNFGTVLAKTAASAAIGGTASKLSGGNFANGAQTGAFQQLFNHVATSKIARYAFGGEAEREMQGLRGVDLDASNDPSLFKSTFEESEHISAMDIDSAVETLDANSHSISQSLCGRYVRWALEAGGVNTTGHPGIAKLYGTLLTRERFRIILQDQYVARKDDVVVFQNYGNQRFAAGHIQMFNGTRWVSDFRQLNFTPGSSYNGVSYEIFRP